MTYFQYLLKKRAYSQVWGQVHSQVAGQVLGQVDVQTRKFL